MKLQKSTYVPVILLVYLAVMSVIGYRGLRTGQNSPTYYYGTIAVTLLIIILLHFFIKKREKYRRERQEQE